MKELERTTKVSIDEKAADWSNISTALKEQNKFSELFFNVESLSDQQKQDLLKSFVLSLHSEASGLVDAVNYKEHRLVGHPVDKQKIVYKSVDAYRYILAILNLWGVSASDFSTALTQKDDFLHYRHKLSQKKWSGQPIVLFDVDDVLAEFRKSFCSYVTLKSGIFIDPENSEYYNISEFKKHGLSNEYFFRTFIENHGLLHLEKNEIYSNLLKELKSRGYWIQILTARPEANLTAFYDTYSWLTRHGIDADGVAFAPEKLTWAASQPYYSEAKYFAVDDSAKHAAEYVKHGIPVVVPQKSYNSEVVGLKNITYVPAGSNPLHFMQKLFAL